MNKLVWVDLETTGLDARRNNILEVGFMVTDTDLRPLVASSWLVKPQSGIVAWDEFAHAMHEKSGLIAAVEADGWDLEEAEDDVLRWLATTDVWAEDGINPPLCGSSVHFDRSFLKQWMPEVEARFSYRNIDVSTVKELAQIWDPVIFESRPGQADEDKAHRVMPDIEASIKELQHYVAQGFLRRLI